MAGVNRRRRLLACYLLLCDISRRRRRENIEESIGFGYGLCRPNFRPIISQTFSLVLLFLILRKFVIKTIVLLYFFNICRGVIRVACRHFEARIWTWSKQSGASFPNASVASIVWARFSFKIRDRLRVFSSCLCRKDRTWVYLGRLIAPVARIVLSDR